MTLLWAHADRCQADGRDELAAAYRSLADAWHELITSDDHDTAAAMLDNAVANLRVVVTGTR